MFKGLNYIEVVCNISLKEHVPEDGLKRWPKHVADFAVDTTVNLHICM